MKKDSSNRASFSPFFLRSNLATNSFVMIFNKYKKNAENENRMINHTIWRNNRKIRTERILSLTDNGHD